METSFTTIMTRSGTSKPGVTQKLDIPLKGIRNLATNVQLCVRFILTILFEIGRYGRKRLLDTFDLQKLRAWGYI